MKFKVGDKIRCMYNTGTEMSIYLPEELTLGKVYTVLEVGVDTRAVYLDSDSGNGAWWFYSTNFLPAHTPPTLKTVLSHLRNHQ